MGIMVMGNAAFRSSTVALAFWPYSLFCLYLRLQLQQLPSKDVGRSATGRCSEPQTTNRKAGTEIRSTWSFSTLRYINIAAKKSLIV